MGGMRMPPILLLPVFLLAACTPSPHAPVPAPVPAAAAAAPPLVGPVRQGTLADVQGSFGNGAPVTVTLHVRDDAGAAMGPEDFQVVHEHKLHVLIVDPSLADYSHVHPEPLAASGDWRFQFTPAHDRPYRLWLDATPVGGRQRYTMVTINGQAPTVPVARRIASEATAAGVVAKLSFDTPPRAGAMASGRIELSRGGKPLTALEPVMGAYAHIVGIGEDWQSIAHVHPMGAEPHAANDRGGPLLRFHLEPRQAGYLALHLQIKVDGRELYLPFGIEVAN
jgi:hypothetical protein